MYSTLYMTVSFCNILLSHILNTFRPELGENKYIISVSNPANHLIAKAEHSFNTTQKLLWNLMTAHTFIWVSEFQAISFNEMRYIQSETICALKKQSADIHVAPLRHIIPIPAY